MRLGGSASTNREESQPPSHFKGPLRIVGSGDPKMDDAIRAALRSFGSRSGVPIDAQTFPAPPATANVLVYSLGRWEDYPPFAGRDIASREQAWRDHRPWLVGTVPPNANPLFAFVAAKVGGDPAYVGATLDHGGIESDLLIGTDARGAVVAGACHQGRNPALIANCLRAIAMVPGPSAGYADHQTSTACRPSDLHPIAGGLLHRLAASFSAAIDWMLQVLHRLFSHGGR
jgi:hypothetical protein